MRTCICVCEIIDHRNLALDAKQYSERNFMDLDDMSVLVVKITNKERHRSDSDLHSNFLSSNVIYCIQNLSANILKIQGV